MKAILPITVCKFLLIKFEKPNEMFHYTCRILPRLITSLQFSYKNKLSQVCVAHIRSIAPSTAICTNDKAVANRLQHPVGFGQPRI